MSKHTPGPWVWRDEALNDLAIEGLLRIGVHYTIDDAAMCARAAIAKAKGETK
jgi:hypothetical protein